MNKEKMNKKKISAGDYIRLNQQKTTKYFPFDIISRKISILRMFCEVIEKHPEDLERSYKKIVSEIENFECGDPLNDYILLEIKDFYRHAYLKFGDKIKFPSSSKYVEDFRNEIIGHLKKKNVREIGNHYIKINEEVGFKKIFNDWVDFRDKVFKKIDNDTKG